MAPVTATEKDSADELLNPQVLVERCMGNLSLAQRLLARFADSGRQDCDQLEAALRAGDLSSLATVAHRLKGSSATIGSNHMAQLASLIEQESKSSEGANLESIVVEIRDVQIEVSKQCQKSVEIYQALLANGGGE